MRLRLFLLSLVGIVLAPCAGPPLWAQAAPRQSSSPASPPPAASKAAPVPSAQDPIDAADYVRQQFGDSFKIDTSVAPMMGDLDGDGNEDLVLVATSAKPLDSQENLHYRVVDPYDEYFGLGDVKITSQFTIHLDGSGRDLLIVEGWRLAQSAQRSKRVSKFVFINTPFQSVRLTSVHHKKKLLEAIDLTDNTGTRAYVQWDGRHWRWSPQGVVDDLPGFDQMNGSGSGTSTGSAASSGTR